MNRQRRKFYKVVAISLLIGTFLFFKSNTSERKVVGQKEEKETRFEKRALDQQKEARNHGLIGIPKTEQLFRKEAKNENEATAADTTISPEVTTSTNLVGPDTTQGDSPETTTEGGSSESTTEGGSSESTTEGGSPETTTEGGSPESTTEGGSPETTTEGGSPETTTEGGSPESTTEGGSLESTTNGDSPETTTEGESLESTTQGDSSESTTKGDSLETTTQGEPLVSTTLADRDTTVSSTVTTTSSENSANTKSCDKISCPENSECFLENDAPECLCYPSFIKNETNCVKVSQFAGKFYFAAADEDSRSVRAEDDENRNFTRDFVTEANRNTTGFIRVDVAEQSSVDGGNEVWDYTTIFDPDAGVTSAVVQNNTKNHLDDQCENGSCTLLSGGKAFDVDKNQTIENVIDDKALCENVICDSTSTKCSSDLFGEVSCDCLEDFVSIAGTNLVCNAVLCVSDIDCNYPFGSCINEGENDVGVCECMTTFSGKTCNDPWLFIFVVSVPLALVVILILITLICVRRRSKTERKDTVERTVEQGMERYKQESVHLQYESKRANPPALVKQVFTNAPLDHDGAMGYGAVNHAEMTTFKPDYRDSKYSIRYSSPSKRQSKNYGNSLEMEAMQNGYGNKGYSNGENPKKRSKNSRDSPPPQYNGVSKRTSSAYNRSKSQQRSSNNYTNQHGMVNMAYREDQH